MTLSKLSKIKVTTENKCGLCTGSICCTYITHEIDTPRSLDNFDYLLWQVSHQNVAIFKDTDGWYMSVNTNCQHLAHDGRCNIYEKRPQICREHSNECCEFDGPAEEDFELYFNNFDSLDQYCKKRFKSWDKRIHT